MDHFDADVKEKLGWYVYRLIDPRSGHTFYVGKGRDDRLFEHVRGLLKRSAADDSDGGEMDLKNEVIRDVQRAGLSVVHVVHRHGLESEDIAYEVEAALIDAYPGLTNLVGGHGSSLYGCRSVEQVVAEYKAQPLVVREPLILIYVGKALDNGRSLYDAVRGTWRMARSKAQNYKLVLAYDGVLVKGAFRPERWLDAKPEHFSWLSTTPDPPRIGFEGKEAFDVGDQYLGRRVPPRKKGSMTPFRYLHPDSSGQLVEEVVEQQ